MFTWGDVKGMQDEVKVWAAEKEEAVKQGWQEDAECIEAEDKESMMAKKKWIKKAISRPGAFKAKAKRAGMSTAAYARKVTAKGSRASARTKRQANLAKTLGKMRKKKK